MRISAAIVCLAILIGPQPGFAGPTPSEIKKCTPCHRLSADDPKERHKGPDLFYAGNKFQKSWLEKFLQHPIVVRKAGYTLDPGFLKGEPVLSGPHLSLGKKQAKAIAAYLGSLKLPGLPDDKIDPDPLTKDQRAKIKYHFERTYGCISCHEGLNLADQVRGGISGPSLANAGIRLQANWIFNWLKNPKKFVARSRMPVYVLDDEIMVALAKYLMTLKKDNLDAHTDEPKE